jgi:hypothetical protein
VIGQNHAPNIKPGINRRMGGPQSWSGRFVENENLFELDLRGKAVVNL